VSCAGSSAGRRPPYCGTACPPTAAAPCAPGLPRNATGWWSSACPPELNPVEGLWSSLKAVELANLATPILGVVIDQAHRGIQRVRRTPHLAYSFLRHAGLSAS
jgi:hypothetical protein